MSFRSASGIRRRSSTLDETAADHLTFADPVDPSPGVN